MNSVPSLSPSPPAATQQDSATQAQNHSSRRPRVLIAGMGLIGGSLALALRASGWAESVVGYARAETAAQAQALGLAQQVSDDPKIATDADIIVLAVPVGSTSAVMQALLPYSKADVVVTDAGSTKVSVVAALAPVLGERMSHFVPGHPIAGSHRSGPSAADPSLYLGKRVILTPDASTDPDALACIHSLWTACGAHVQQLTAAQHDSYLGAVSHLPHLVAFATIGALLGADQGLDAMKQAGSGFRDFTRIAASDSTMWADIFTENGDAVLARLNDLETELQALRSMIANGERDALRHYFERARSARAAWESDAARCAPTPQATSSPTSFNQQVLA